MLARLTLLGAAILGLATTAVAAPIPVVEAGARAPVVERAIISVPAPKNEPMMLLNQIDTLQREIMELRGLLEEQSNMIVRVQKENRDRYLDLDRRIGQMITDASSRSTVSDTSDKVSSPSASVSQRSGGAAIKKIDSTVLYKRAYQFIRERRYAEAITGMKQYLEQDPNGAYAGNAQYWLGEIYLAQGNLQESKDRFVLLLKKHAGSDKHADATYKLGQVYDRLGDNAKARQYLQQVIKDFPSSSAARLADVYLRNLED